MASLVSGGPNSRPVPATQGVPLLKGNPGTPGLSAYELAVQHGFVGTYEEWYLSLKGPKGDDGKNAYETAVENGFVGTYEEWYLSLKGPKGDPGQGTVDLDAHINSLAPHPVYDDVPDMTLIFENGLI